MTYTSWRKWPALPVLAVAVLLFVFSLNLTQAQNETDFAPEPPAATAFTEPFDNASQFTTSTGFFSDDAVSSGFDYFGLAGTSPDWGGDPAPSGLKSYTGFTGTYLAGMDLDGEGASLPITLDWTGISITGLSNLEFTGAFGEFFDSPGDIDPGDYIRLYYQVDGGGYQNLLWFSGADFSTSVNGIFRQDTNFDGTGDGTALTDTLTSFTAAIPATGSTLDLRMEVSVNSGDEDFAMDEFSVQENVPDTTPPGIISLNPADNATDIRTDQTLIMVFDEPIQFTMDTTLRLQIGSNGLGLIEQFYPTDPTDPISIVNGNTVVVDPTNPLPANDNIFVVIDNGTILDLAGNQLPGITDNTTWNFGTITPTSAVTAPLLEDFSVCPTTGWQVFSDDSDTANTWACETNNGDTVYGANGFGNSAPADEWLITPSIDLSSLTTPTATFETWTRFADGGIAGEEIDFLYSTDYDGAGNLAGSTWTELSFTPSPEDSQVFTFSGPVDLSSIGATTAYFAFRYQSSGTGGGNAAWWQVDDFSIDEPPPPDVLINEISVSDVGTDAEFFELFGASGTSLDDTYLIGLYADNINATNNKGVVDFVMDLSANSIQADGFFVGSSPEANTTYSITGDYSFTDNTFSNASMTYALVYNPSGILLAAGDDLDTNDDGVLDIIPWTDVVDSVAQTDGATGLSFYFSPPIVGPDGSFLPAGAYRCSDGGTFDPANLLNFNPENGTPDSSNSPLCTITPTLIHNVQGGPGTYGANNFNGILDESPLIGTSVTVQGVVVGDFQETDEFSGFFIQEESSDEDGDPATSEGIFVFCDTTCADVSIGNIVTVTGNVDEFFNHTQLDNDSSTLAVTIDDSNNNLNLVTAASVNFPMMAPASATDHDPKEAYEGMLVDVTTTMRVTEYFQYGRYTQVRVWNDGTTADRPYQYTQQNTPSTTGFPAAERAFVANSFFLDDGNSAQNTANKPYPPNFLDGTLNEANGFRGGDSVTDIYGVMSYTGSTGSGSAVDWRVHVYDPSTGIPLERADGSTAAVPTFTNDNPRPGATVPANVSGTFKVGSVNVLNYFTDIDDGTCALSSCRGADDLSEFQRQHDKITDMICQMDSDVIGLMEIENDATDNALNVLVNGGMVTDQNSSSSIVVDGLNTICPTTNGWDYVATGAVGTDAIRVAFIYDTTTAAIAPGTTAEVLNDTVANNLGFSAYLPLFDGASTNRAALAVTFEEIATGAELTIANNHFKSKGGSGSGANADQGDGQGNWNERRTQAAEVLRTWLAGNPTGTTDPDVLIIGDLNAYAQEDPIVELTTNGYTDLAISNIGLTAYSFVFDGRWGTLDYALANADLLGQVAGIAEWHINADEPSALSYDETFDPSYWYANNFYRASDHDPVVVGMDLTAPTPTIGITAGTDAVENGADGDFVLTNSGSSAVTVELTIGGTADAADYFFSTGSVAGSTLTVSVPATGLTLGVTANDDADAISETLQLDIVDLAAYDPDPTDNSASIQLIDDDVAPADTNLLTNGDFSAPVIAPWFLFGDYSFSLNAGVMEFYRLEPGWSGTVLAQQMAQPFASGSPMQVDIDLGNNSTEDKAVLLTLRNSTFSDSIQCAVTVPAGSALSTVTMQGLTDQAWTSATLVIRVYNQDNAPALRVDNASVQYRPTAGISGYDCTGYDTPTNTELVRNGDFSTSFLREWILFGDYGYSTGSGTMEFWRTSIATRLSVLLQIVGAQIDAGTPLRLQLDLSSTSTASKTVQIFVRSETWEESFRCDVVIPAGAAPQTVTVEGITTFDWPQVRIVLRNTEADGLPAVVVDNVSLQYIPGMTPTACTDPFAGTVASPGDTPDDVKAPPSALPEVISEPPPIPEIPSGGPVNPGNDNPDGGMPTVPGF